MGAPKGNQFYRLRADLSKDGKKLSIKEITEKAQEYIDYCLHNPILVEDFKGSKKVIVKKMRIMHLWGLWHHLGIVEQTWTNWKKDEKYLGVLTKIEQIIKLYKLEGAAAGELKEQIVIRDLGLKEQSETKLEIEQPLFPDDLGKSKLD